MNRLFLALIVAAAPATTPARAESTNKFLPLELDRFYQRLLSSHKPSEAWGLVPQGMTNFDGVPFRMLGYIELTGLGPARNNSFYPTRVGVIPVGRRATKLHFIHGAAYADPDDTPIAAVRFFYTRGGEREVFLRYGVHVRNWYVEKSERNARVSHAGSRVIWEGNTRADGRGTPTRLFKTTLENPQPGDEVRGLELLSLFGRANLVILAMTVEESTGGGPVAVEEEEDIDLRREVLVRTVDAGDGRALSNVLAEVSVAEQGRRYGFGSYRSDAHGQILLDYPPGKFQELHLRFPELPAFTLGWTNEGGHFPSEVPVRIPRELKRPAEK